jgi:hypothetical protein
VEHAAAHELARGERGEVRLHQPPLVVSFLWPRIGEEEVDGGERRVPDHARQHLQRVVTDHPQVGQPVPGNPVEQAADAGPVHLDGNEIGIRTRPGDRRRRFAHP